MALSTKVVDSKAAAGGSTAQAFSAPAWGKENFPKVQEGISKRAEEASTLASAVASNPTAAGKKYGGDAGGGPEGSVEFTGVGGKSDARIYPGKGAGVPKGLLGRIPTPPAHN